MIFVAALGLGLVACGSGTRVSSISPVSALTQSNVQGSSATALPNVGLLDVGLLDVEHGVELVAVSSGRDELWGSSPQSLWVSTDATHWRDVTPPGSQDRTGAGLYPSFDEASFLDPDTGWVTTWNAGSLAVTIYSTSNGGQTWRVAGTGGHGDHAGDAEWIQLVTPTTAFAETIGATEPSMSLEVTRSGGATWRTVYNGPPPRLESQPELGPFELPMTFISPLRGFAASGIPPAEYGLGNHVFTTHDGGISWTRVVPPQLESSLCAAAESNASQCLFALPAFFGPTDAVIVGEVIAGDHATVGFDTSSDSGASWYRAATVDVHVPPTRTDGYPKTYALASTPSITTWWIASSFGDSVMTRVTIDAGQHWSSTKAPEVLGAPTGLRALDDVHALLATSITSSDNAMGALYRTDDGGATWKRLFTALPSS